MLHLQGATEEVYRHHPPRRQPRFLAIPAATPPAARMKITVQNKNQSFECRADEGILAAALRQNIVMPYGCRGGRCGSCMGDVVGGEFTYPDGRPPGISAAEASAGKALFCQARARSDMVIRVNIIATPQGIAPRNMPARVERVERLAADVMRVRLKTPAGERLQFLAGQYVDFILRDGRRRAFSIANPPQDDAFLEFHIRHVPGGYFTHIVFAEMREKSLIRIEGPLGAFYLRQGDRDGRGNPASDDRARPIIMMGGGTGIAPLRGMLLHMFATNDTRPAHLFWGVRAAQDLYLRDEIGEWQKARPDTLQFTPVLSEPQPGDHWRGAVGWVHEAVVKTYPDLSAHEVYMSGPPPMIHAAKDAFLAHGLSPERMYSDAFDFADDPGVSAADKENQPRPAE